LRSNSRIALLLCVVGGVPLSALAAGFQPGAAFEPNRGQAPPSVKYLARTSEGAVLLTDRSIVLLKDGRSRIEFEIAGARAYARATGKDAAPGLVSYFRGDTAIAAVPRFRRVVYPEIYPRIDLTWYFAGQQIEFDLLARPGANLRRIQLQFPADAVLALTEAGDLSISSDGQSFRLRRPAAWQEAETGRRSVDCTFQVRGRRVSFLVGQHDVGRPLVIDPVIDWATLYGGSGNDHVVDMALDAQGYTYLAGTTNSPDLPEAHLLSGPLNRPVSMLHTDAFVAKFTPDGSELVWALYIGGTEDDAAEAIGIDSAGAVYLLGSTASINFPKTPGSFKTSGTGLFLTKIDPSGSKLTWSTLLGLAGELANGASPFSDDQLPYLLALESSGTAVIAGSSLGANFQTTPGVFETTAPAAGAPVLMRMNAEGSAPIYATYFGGSGGDRILGIRQAADGSAYIVGESDSSDFPMNSGVMGAFAAKLSATGQLVFATVFAPQSNANDIAVASDGRLFVTGSATASTFPQVNPAPLPPLATGITPRADAAFLAVLAPDGSRILQSTMLGQIGAAAGIKVAVTPGGQGCILSGETVQTGGGLLPANALFGDGLICIDPATPSLVFSTGVPGFSLVAALAIDAQGHIFLAGDGGVGSNATAGAFQTEPGGTDGGATSDGFLMRLSPSNPVPVLSAIQPQTTASPLQSFLTYTVQLFGAGFGAGDQVLWNGSPVTTTFLNSSVLSIVLPQAAVLQPGTVTLQVQAPPPGGGTSDPLSFYVVNPPPVFSIYPSSVPQGSADTTVTFFGALTPKTTVVWNGQTLSTQPVAGSSALTAVIPAAQLATAGSYAVSATTPQPGGGSFTQSFVVTPTSGTAAPIIRGIVLVPGDGAGPNNSAPTVNGWDFTQSSVVRWNGAAVPTTFINSQMLSFTPPSADVHGIGEADITVATGSLVSNAIPAFYGPARIFGSMIFDAKRNMVYGVGGTSTSEIDAMNLSDGSIKTMVGSLGYGPLLAMTEDNQYIYYGGYGDSAIHRINLDTQAEDFHFSLGNDDLGNPAATSGLSIIPGSSDSVVVSSSANALAIFDHGWERPVTGPDVVPTLSPSTISFVWKDAIAMEAFGSLCAAHFTFDAYGMLDGEQACGGMGALAPDYLVDNGLAYYTDGTRFVPVYFTPVQAPGTYSNPIVPIQADLTARRVYALISGNNGELRVYNLDSLALVQDVGLGLIDPYGGGILYLGNERILVSNGTMMAVLQVSDSGVK
jgi:hypothetical protein